MDFIFKWMCVNRPSEECTQKEATDLFQGVEPSQNGAR